MSQKLLKNSIISEIKNSSLRKSNFAALFYLRIYGTSEAHVIVRNLYNRKFVTLAHKLDLHILIFNVSQLKYLYYLKMYMCVSNVTAY